jgi:F5/8 type C domain-containing protein
MLFLHYSRISVLLIILILLFAVCLFAEEQRIIPVSYKSCGPDRNSVCSADHLWDFKDDTDNKWCCFHAGYHTEQAHWVIMDLGSVYPISRIVVIHNGITGERHLFTEDFQFFASAKSMDGPWSLIQTIVDNNLKTNDFPLSNVNARYLGLEVTDPQTGAGPNQKQDDWAVRINEVKIYTSDGNTAVPEAPVASPSKTNNPFIVTGSNPSSPVYNPANPAPSTYSQPWATTEKKQILYFYNEKVTGCQQMMNIFAMPDVKKSFEPYDTKQINSGSPLFSKYNVFKVPTLIITDSRGNVIKRTSGTWSKQELLAFLQ